MSPCYPYRNRPTITVGIATITVFINRVAVHSFIRGNTHRRNPTMSFACEPSGSVGLSTHPSHRIQPVETTSGTAKKPHRRSTTGHRAMLITTTHNAT